MIDVESILNSISLNDLVERAGGNLYKSGAEWRCACPLHGGKNPTGFSIYRDGGREKWKCFTGDCGGGDAITFVQKWQNVDFKNACQFLDGKTIEDPQEMMRLSQLRAENAKKELDEAIERANAARAQLQAAQLHVHYHETMREWGRMEWLRRGIDESYQGLWNLGACDDKKIFYDGKEYHTPTITIPIVDKSYNLLNIQHRLINPPNPHDRYRPEREGLGSPPPFFAWPEMGFDADLTWIIEGGIKSMVTATISPDAGWQFVGLSNKHSFDKLPFDELRGRKTIIVPDPGEEQKAWEIAKKIRARFVLLPDKIDDMILREGLDGSWLASLTKQARIA